jgi:NAD(P)-dependent dehydrogenase (short-subunit alcohol dehydrogenase family)
VVVTDVDVAAPRRTADAVTSAEAHQLDVTDPAACEPVVQKIVGVHGRLDVWVFNAGISKMQRSIDVAPLKGIYQGPVSTQLGVVAEIRRTH